MDPLDSPIYIANIRNQNNGVKKPYNLYSYAPINLQYPLFTLVFVAAFADIIADELDSPASTHYSIWGLFVLLIVTILVLDPSACNEVKRADHTGKIVKLRRPIFGFKGHELLVDADDIAAALRRAGNVEDVDDRFSDGYRYGFAYYRIRLPWGNVTELEQDVDEGHSRITKLEHDVDEGEKLLEHV